MFLLININIGAVELLNITNQDNLNNQKILLQFDANIESYQSFNYNSDLVIDLIGVNNFTNKTKFNFSPAKIKTLNLFNNDHKTRIILNNAVMFKHQLIINNKSMEINFSFKSDTNKQMSSKIIIDRFKLQSDNNGGGLIEFNYQGNQQLNYNESKIGNKLKFELIEVNISPDLQKIITANDFEIINNNYIHLFFKNNKLQLIVECSANWNYIIYQLDHKLIINIRKTLTDSLIQKSEQKIFSQKVSFNFQNIELKSLLQLMAEQSGYNILISDGVKGNISLRLNNVTWIQALNLILNTKSLMMKKDGNIIRIAPVGEIIADDKDRLENQKTQDAVEPLSTVTFRLKYTKALNLYQILMNDNKDNEIKNNKSLLLLSARGSILYDERTNTIIVNDAPTVIAKIQDIINRIDVAVKQVLIEARIVEAKNDFERSLGVNLMLAGVIKDIKYSNTINNALKVNSNGSINSTSNNFNNYNFGFNGGGQIATIFSPNSDSLIGLEIDALEAKSEGRTISNPKVMTANYQQASIQQGVQIPYPQASSAGNTNIAFIDAVLSLQVTPQIIDDGNIILDVNIHKDTPSEVTVHGTPEIDTNSVNTQVQVADGATILVGGIYIDQQSKVIQQIPLLGDIPLLGWLFKGKTEKKIKRELLIFITPKIIASNSDVN